MSQDGACEVMEVKTEYEKGFLDALERVVFMGQQLWDYHMKNAQDKTMSKEDQEAAFNFTCAIGTFVSHVKTLGAHVARDQVTMPIEVKDRHWWSSPDGKGKS